LGTHGIGTPEGVSAVSREMLLDTVARCHIPSNTVVIGTGRIDHDLLRERTFAAFPLNNDRIARIHCLDDGAGPPVEKRQIIEVPGREKAILAFGCKIRVFSHRESAVFTTTAYMLDSMIEEEIREKRGFAYITGSSWRSDRALGADVRFVVGTLPKRILEVESLMPEILSSYPLGKEQFLRIKDKLTDGSLVSLERPADWGRVIAERIVEEGGEISMLRSYSKLDRQTIASVEFEEVVAMREKIFLPERLTCVIVRPL
jgi:predicted Zn-dependent peptidase